MEHRCDCCIFEPCNESQKNKIWNGISSDMFIETIFMMYGKGPKGIIDSTLQPSVLKRRAYSMNICCKVVTNSANITQRTTKAAVIRHKDENPSRINSDNQDRQKIRTKLQMCTNPLDPPDHPN